MAQTIADLAKLVRSKNAGPFWLTFDIMFEKREDYDRVCAANILTRECITRIYGLRQDETILVVNHEAALAIKVSFPRQQSSGSAHDSDIFGGQQYAPLLALEV